MAINRKVKCPYCWAENNMKIRELATIKMDGKVTRRCFECNKSFTVKQIEEKELYGTR